VVEVVDMMVLQQEMVIQEVVEVEVHIME